MTSSNWLHRFKLSNRDRWIGGVCGGLGIHTPVPAWSWRVLFVLFTLFFGTAILVYILLWIFVPRQTAEADPESSL